MARTKNIASRKRIRSRRQSGASPSTTQSSPRTPTSSFWLRRTPGQSKRSQAFAQQNPSTQKGRGKSMASIRTVAFWEIRHYQKTWRPLIPAASFIRCAAEDFLVNLFEDGMLCAIHAKRVTLIKRILSWLGGLEGRDNLGENIIVKEHHLLQPPCYVIMRLFFGSHRFLAV